MYGKKNAATFYFAMIKRYSLQGTLQNFHDLLARI